MCMLVTDVRTCAKNKERVNIYAEQGFLFACYKEVAVKHHIKTGAQLDDALAREVIREDGERYAFNVALKYISVKPRTSGEVEKKLREKEISGEAVRYALDKLIDYGYIDDTEYARMFARELSAKYGSRMIEHKLMARGIGLELAKQAAAECGQGALEEVYGTVRRKYAGEAEPKRTQKMMRAMVSRGFGYDEIRRVMGADNAD